MCEGRASLNSPLRRASCQEPRDPVPGSVLRATPGLCALAFRLQLLTLSSAISGLPFKCPYGLVSDQGVTHLAFPIDVISVLQLHELKAGLGAGTARRSSIACPSVASTLLWGSLCRVGC